AVRDARPAVIFWYRAYSGLMAVGSLVLGVVGVVSGAAPLAMIGSAFALAAFCGLATFVPFKPWGWTVALVAIGLGLAGGTAIFAIPLLVYWFKPQVKAAVARPCGPTRRV